MLIASTNIVPMIQLRQANAASPTTSSFKDNLRANLGNRNQHLNQQGNCIRTDGCTTSDVGQGTLGNDNSVTGFADLSDNTTFNITSTANSGAEGLPGGRGAQGLPGVLKDLRETQEHQGGSRKALKVIKETQAQREQ